MECAKNYKEADLASETNDTAWMGILFTLRIYFMLFPFF